MDGDSTASRANRSRGRRFLITLLLVGVVGAVPGAILVGHARNYFEIPPYPPELQAKVSEVNPFEKHSGEIVALVKQHASKTAIRNTSLAFALLAATTMPFLGFAAGAVLGSVKDAMRGFVVGIVAGSLLGGIAGGVAAWVSAQLNTATQWESSAILLASHISLWTVFSVGLTLTLVSATSQWDRLGRTVIAGAIAGCASAMIYQPLVMFVFPLEQLDGVISAGASTQALLSVLGVGLICFAIARSLAPARSISPADDSSIGSS